MLFTVEISSEREAKMAAPEQLVRQMYDLLGANMTQIIDDANRDWQADAEFRKWKAGVLFLSYTADPDSAASLFRGSREMSRSVYRTIAIAFLPSTSMRTLTLLCVRSSCSPRADAPRHPTRNRTPAP